MSKCLKCGASLPPVGDCPTCAAVAQPAGRAVPSLLDKDILIDRRAAPVASTPAPATPPGMTARAPVPPGLTPAPRTPASGTPGLPVMPPRPPAQAAAPAPAQAPAFNLPGVAAPAPRAAAPTVGAPTSSAPAPRQASAPGLPVMPPRPNVAAAPPASPSLDVSEEESFSVEVEDAEPSAPPVAAAPARPAPAPAPRKAPAAQPSDLEVHARPASLWRRLLALTIDTGAIAGVAALYLMLASSVAGVKSPQTALSGLDAFVVQLRALESVLVPGLFLVFVLSLVYCTVSAFLWNGRTLGRRLLGLRLVDTRGLAPAPGRAVIRALLAGLSFGLFLAGFWMALFDRRGQTLHDKLTSTYVVQPS